jgi:hypothetical protein
MLLETIGQSPNFEAIFGVRAEHRLEQIRSRSGAGARRRTVWEHEEYDRDGHLVARYEAFQEIEPETGAARSGWTKYDRDGWVVDEGRITRNIAAV